MKINLFGLLLLPAVCFGQVGINNTAPQGTLDITAKNATGTSTNADGVLIPRVDRQRIQSMTGVQTSTMVYVNSVATGTQAGTAINVDTVGYYYYNGTAWVKLISGSSNNIYSTDGTLAANRTVTQADKTLAFTGTAVNAFSIDGKTFSIDAANDRLGVGTSAPQGIVNFVTENKGLGAANDFYFDGYGTSVSPALFLGSAGGTEAAPINLTAGVNIGSINFKPRVNGGWLYETSRMYSLYQGNGTDNLTDLRFDTSAALRMIIDQTGNVGVGTATPQKTFHVNGTAQITNELNVGGTATTPGSAGTSGQVLTSGGAGASPKWVNASSLAAADNNIYSTDGTLSANRTVIQADKTLAFTGTAVNAFSVDGATFSVDAANDRLGIGTATPTEKLDVNGNVRIRGAADGSNVTDFPKAVVMKTDGTLGTAAVSNVSLQSYQLRIPPLSNTADFTNHSNTGFDSDNWWVISKASTIATANTTPRMTIVYEFQGTAFTDPAKIFPQMTAGNASGFTDVFVPSFVSLQNVGGKTRLTVTIVRVDNINTSWGATFLLNVLFAIKG
ncbi:hypothetical protein [Chryseobacterium sp. OSA05B]|uniref:hypothetical protein n=1 Tax=Chryseobacterium sp. OSA05B TaxID=2862650 RepID=UPI001CBE8CF5|nr:hypothetical protein [Chryseobacterium sp. OSA05B]